VAAVAGGVVAVVERQVAGAAGARPGGRYVKTQAARVAARCGGAEQGGR